MKENGFRINSTVVQVIMVCVLVAIVGLVSWCAGLDRGWDKGYANGVESAKGQVLEAISGEAYELRMYGYKDGRVYEMEGSYGYSVNGQAVLHELPINAQRGDTAICVQAGEGIKILPKM